jgi:hypothetical protein
LNFGELKTAVETVTGSSTDTGRYLNKAQLILAKNSKIQKSASVEVTAGVIAIPSDCLVPRSIKYDGVELDYVEKNMTVSTLTDTAPTKWTKINGKIQLNTSVTVTQSSGTCKLYYTPRPATMTLSTDTPELPDCDDALIAYARYKLYTDVEDEESAAYWEVEWLKERAEWLDLNGMQDYEIETIENVLGW